MPVRRTTGVVCLVAVSLAASAQTPVGPVVTLATNGAAADVAIDAAGQSVVVWQADDGDQTGIFGRRIDALGNPAGDAFRVNEGTTGGQWAPTVASGPGGEFVVLWTSQVGSVPRVVFRRFDAAGVPQGGDVQADVDPAQEVLPRSVAIDPSGAFLVVWDTRPGLGVSDVLARRFDASGSPLGAPFRVSSGTTGNPGAAAAAPLRDGGFIVAWNRDMGSNPNNENGQLVARAFDATGLPRGDEFPVRPETETSVPLRAQVTAEADGGFLVTWAYDVSRDRASRAGRSFDASLAPRQAEFQVAAKRWSNDGDEYEAIEQVAAGPPGGFVVVADRWTYDYEGYYINQQVNARRINGAGTLLEPEFVVAPEYPSDGPRVAATAAGDFVVVWSRNGNVRARRFLWNQNTGRLTGRVFDGTSGLPLPDANVRAGRFNDLTDAAGAYSILLTAGSHSATVELHGYASDTVPVVITAGGETTQDFVLRRVPILRVAGTTVDDATGNANGDADVNECFGLRVDLSNFGAGDATAASATLATTTANVTVQQGVSAYPDLPPGGTAANTVAFGIKTSPTFVPGTMIQFTLTVATAQGPFTLPVSLPTAAAVKRQAFDSSGPVTVNSVWWGWSGVNIPVTGIQGVITRVQVRIHATRRVPGSMRLSLSAPYTPLDVGDTRLSGYQFYPSDGLGTDCPADANDVTFQDDAASLLDSAPPPHVGAYRPLEPLARFAGRSGALANGTWTILASDTYDDRSVIECARLLITYHAARSGECEEVAIAGTVTRADTGARVAGATVRTDTAFQTVTDADGRYRLAVTPGPHKIEVEADGHSPGSAMVTAVAGSTVNADIVLVPVVLAVDSIVVDDTGPGGNGNGRVDFDEAFRLSVRLSNTGSAASNVFAGLWPVSGGVVVTRPLSGYPALPVGVSDTNTPPFELRTTPGLIAGQPLQLRITLVVAGRTVEVPVSLETGTPSGLPTAMFTGTEVVNVSGLSGPVAKVVAQTYVEARHTSDVELRLRGPGSSITLKVDRGFDSQFNLGTSCPADDDDLTFDDAAETFIMEGSWPWRGRFRPLRPLSAFAGKPGNGEWRLSINDPSPNERVACTRLLIDTFASAGADLPDLIFRDGFDTPSAPFAPWSEATDDPDLGTATAARVRPTPLGMRATVNDRTGLFVRHDMPGGENRYRARFHFDPNGFDPGEAGGRHRAMIFLGFADAPQKRMVQVVLRRLGGVYALRGVVRLDDDTLAETPFVEITDAPHVIELDWRRATDPAAHDGGFELFVDGGSAGRLDGLDNDLRALDFARLGAMTLKDGAAGTLYFDQFEARRVLPIGPWVP